MSAPLDLGPSCSSCFPKRVWHFEVPCPNGGDRRIACLNKVAGCRRATWTVDGYCSPACRHAAADRHRRQRVMSSPGAAISFASDCSTRIAREVTS